jgi:hypothetical protein
MVKILDEEIKRLEHLMERSIDLTIERTEYKKFVDLVPAPAVSERLLRYETHLSREFSKEHSPSSSAFRECGLVSQ